jgi:hypothetical protein
MLRIVAVAASLVLVASGLAVEFKVTPDKENVVASRLEGEWRVDKDLNERLHGSTRKMETVVFRSDASVAAMIPAAYREFLDGKPIYMAGRVTLDGTEYPFILVEKSGNPHVVMFRARGDDPMGDAESCNIMLAPAKDRAQDVLLIGADFNNEPFRAYERAERSAQPK